MEHKHTPRPVAFEADGQNYPTRTRATEENSPFLRAVAKRKAERAALLSALQKLVWTVDQYDSAEGRALQEHQVMRTARAVIADATGGQS